jgi:hypothetical protein
MQVSYADVYGIQNDLAQDQHIQAGDLVRTGPNLFPHFSVIAVHGDKAWVRNVQDGMDGLARLDRCRKINGPHRHDA